MGALRQKMIEGIPGTVQLTRSARQMQNLPPWSGSPEECKNHSSLI
jgi:hypothetical protein